MGIGRMSIWGKIIGGTAGFAIGGPLGGLIGAMAGHGVDVYTSDSTQSRQAAFSIALVALSAKMAKADGVVLKQEILAFREKVDIMPEDVAVVSRIWNLAHETPDGFEGYAKQVATMFAPASAVLEQLMDLLFHIARADGHIDPSEMAYLETVAGIFGFDERGFERLCAYYGDDGVSPYRLLGLDPDCEDGAVRGAWLKMAAQYHPDRLTAQGLPGECIKAANDRLARINGAYEMIRRERGV